MCKSVTDPVVIYWYLEARHRYFEAGYRFFCDQLSISQNSDIWPQNSNVWPQIACSSSLYWPETPYKWCLCFANVVFTSIFSQLAQTSWKELPCISFWSVFSSPIVYCDVMLLYICIFWWYRLGLPGRKAGSVSVSSDNLASSHHLCLTIFLQWQF